MVEKIIELETAKLAKEKGFNIPVWDFFDENREEENVIGWIGDSFEEKLEFAKEFVEYWRPTQSLLQKWLREVHHIDVWVVPSKNLDEELCYSYLIDTLNYTDSEDYTTYEEALEEGLQEALKLI